MVSAFGNPKHKKDVRKSVFCKLGRSLSVEYTHKHKTGNINNLGQPQMKHLIKSFDINQDRETVLQSNTPQQYENLSDGYASGKDTDAASIDLLDRSKPWSRIRKRRRRLKSNKHRKELH